MKECIKEIYIVLVNYNGIHDTLECIESIVSGEKQLNYKIVIVDNKSTDNSREVLRKDSRVTLLESMENGGFAKGNNIGIKYCLEDGAKYILLLNNDTVIEKESITKLLNALKENKQYGVLGSRIMNYYNKDIINYLGGHYNWLKATTIHDYAGKRFKNKYYKSYIIKSTEFITGCCMLIKREVFEKVGMLPEEYFMYYEDADFCLKVREKGFMLGVCPGSVIYHKESASSGGNNSPFSIKWGNRNRLIFIKKYTKYTKGFLTITTFYITRILLYLKYTYKHDIERKNAIKEGILEGRKYSKK